MKWNGSFITVLLLSTSLSSNAVVINENYDSSASTDHLQHRHMQTLDPAICDNYYYLTRVRFGSTMGLTCTEEEVTRIGFEIDSQYDQVLALDNALSDVQLDTQFCFDSSTGSTDDDGGVTDDGFSTTRGLMQDENKVGEQNLATPTKSPTRRPIQRSRQLATPTNRPTLRPTLSPRQRYFLTTKYNYNWVGSGSCNLCLGDNKDRKLLRSSYAVVDFSTDSRGRILEAGAWIRFQWRSQYGMKIRALPNEGGVAPNSKARLFNSNAPTANDFELGSPNAFCNPEGPGWGDGGVPGTPGENCIQQGNVLIIQENNTDVSVPDDSVHGGRLVFSFDSPTRVGHLGLMSMSEVPGSNWIDVLTHDGKEIRIDFEGLGENSVQLVYVRHVVKKVELVMRKGGAVTEIGLFTPTTAEEALSAEARSYIQSKSPFQEYIPYLEFDLSYYLTRHINNVFGMDVASCLYGKWVNVDVQMQAVPVLVNRTCDDVAV
jgi:hypothetical protein